MKYFRGIGVALVALLVVAQSSAGVYGTLRRTLSAAHTPQEAADAVAATDISQVDARLADEIDNFVASPNSSSWRQLRSDVELRADVESSSQAGAQDEAIKKIKSEPGFRDRSKDPGGENWLVEALRKIRIPDFQPRRLTMPNAPAVGVGWLIQVVWILLGLACVVFLFLAVRFFTSKQKARKKASAVLEDDEPERTLDEWLTLADVHARAGRYRDAVRCLYLACLLRFDENRVARFDRTETNWQHLARINASPARPADLDFTTPTQAFDRIWYGHRTEGVSDVERFRAIYEDLSRTLSHRPKVGPGAGIA